MSVHEKLAQAILYKKPCLISKSGEAQRKICPYRLGKSREAVVNVLYYQYDGYTARSGGLRPDGSSDNWRCNRVSDIDAVDLIDEGWHQPIQKPKNRGPCVEHEYVEISGYYD